MAKPVDHDSPEYRAGHWLGRRVLGPLTVAAAGVGALLWWLVR